MADLKFYIDGNQTANLPVEYQDLKVSIDWSGSRQTQIEFDALTFRNEDAELIQSFFTDALGCFVNRPFEIGVNGYSLPRMMLNLRDNYTEVGDTEVVVGVEMVNQKDWISTQAAPLQFKRLEDEGKFLPTDFYQVPYNINYIPDGMQVLMLNIAIFQTTTALIQLIKETAEQILEGTFAVVPSVGLGVVTNVGAILLAIAKIVVRVAYFIGLAIAITQLIKSLFAELYSKTRYHTAIYIKSLFRVACLELGLTFKSDLLDGAFESQLVIMPSKTERGAKNSAIKNGGAPSRSDDGLYFFGEFITSMMESFNADYRISNGEFRFERWDWWQNNSTAILDSNWSNQDRRLDERKYNTNEFYGGYFITALLDQTDRNTLDNAYGLAYDVITNNNVSIGKEYDNSGGNRTVNLPFAYGTRKNTLTNFENLLKALAKIVDSATSLFGNGSNFVGQFEGRKANLLLSDHFTEKAKILYVDNVGLAPNQSTSLNSQVFWNNYHFINSFFPIGGIHNQWIERSMIMKINDYFYSQILENNFLKDSEGNDVEVMSLDWVMYKDHAEITYRTNEIYNNSLQQSYILTQNSEFANQDV